MNRRSFIISNFIVLNSILFASNKVNAIEQKKLNAGDLAPSFKLEGSSISEPNKSNWGLDDFIGNWLVLYFYPKDFTGGCTIEARGFSQLQSDFTKLDTNIVGISADKVDDHMSFCSSEGLKFPLLSDPDGKVSKAYGSWMAPYSMRHTFLINPDGVISKKWVAVRPSGHANEVLDFLSNAQNNLFM